MRTIWKIPIVLSMRIEIEGPGLAKVLHIGDDPNGDLCAWVIVRPEAKQTTIFITVVGTGNPIPDNVLNDNHVCTMVDGVLVWHFFATRPRRARNEA